MRPAFWLSQEWHRKTEGCRECTVTSVYQVRFVDLLLLVIIQWNALLLETNKPMNTVGHEDELKE